MNGIRYMYIRTVYGAVYGVVHGTVYRSYKKPYRASIRIVYVSYNGSYTKHFFTGLPHLKCIRLVSVRLGLTCIIIGVRIGLTKL